MDQQHAEGVSGPGLLAGLALQHRQLDVHGTATALAEGGQGGPLVLIHGGIQVGGLVWWRTLPWLLAEHRVVIPDVPGLGQSLPLAALDPASFSDWLAALLRLTCEEPPTLVAHSAPGGLAARFAARHPTAIRQLVLVDAGGLGAFRPSPGFLAALLRANLRPSPHSSERFLQKVVADIDRIRTDNGAAWETFVAEVASRSPAPEVKRAMRQLVKAGTRRLADHELAAIDVPTVLLWGRQDPLIPLAIAESVSATRHWPLHIIDHAGHLPHVEQPQAFAHTLASTLR